MRGGVASITSAMVAVRGSTVRVGSAVRSFRVGSNSVSRLRNTTRSRSGTRSGMGISRRAWGETI